MNANNIFNWDDYLEETGSIAAPIECFKQYPNPPKNLFEIGMKLMAKNPRRREMIPAIVVDILGPRLRLKFYENPSLGEVWKLVDSNEIYPDLRWAFETGPEAEKIAPVEIFVREPLSPQHNFFEVGMKLEAVDKLSPNVIGVATVGEVNEEQIYVEFDGWRGTSDFWCDYDSREIFRVGWCEKSGHPLHTPRHKVPAVIQPEEPDDPSRWSVDEVMEYIVNNREDLAVYADAIRENEINGEVVMLLSFDTMQERMQLPLGPAVKMWQVIEEIKALRVPK